MVFPHIYIFIRNKKKIGKTKKKMKIKNGKNQIGKIV